MPLPNDAETQWTGYLIYYKRMAAAPFLESVDRCVSRAIQSLSGTTPQVVELAALGRGKFGG